MTNVNMEIRSFLFLGHREGFGMDVVDVELQMRLIRQPDDRHTDDKQLHIRIALRAMIRWRLTSWAVLKLSISGDPMALITQEGILTEYILIAFWAFQLINLRKKIIREEHWENRTLVEKSLHQSKTLRFSWSSTTQVLSFRRKFDSERTNY